MPINGLEYTEHNANYIQIPGGASDSRVPANMTKWHAMTATFRELFPIAWLETSTVVLVCST